MSRLKQGISLLLAAAMVTGAPAVFANPAEKAAVEAAAAGTLETAAEPAAFQYITNETFDKALTDEQTQIIPTADNWSGAVKAEAQDGKLNMVHQGANGGKNEVSYQVNLPFLPGTDKTCAVIPRGKTYVSMDYELNKSGKNGLSVRVCDNMGTTGQLPFGVRVDITPAAVEAQQNNDEKWVSLGNLEGMDFTSGKIKIGVDAAEQGTTKIIGVWITPKGGTETLIPGTQNAEMGDIGTGLYKLILYPPFGAEAGYEPEAGTVVGSIDNLKVWESAQTQLETLAQMGTAVDFAAVKGSNADAQNITGDLNLSAGLTPGGLKTLSWESGNPAVISNEGKVTRPAEDTAVTLTPTLMLAEDAGETKEGYVACKGEPMTVTVKAKTDEPVTPPAQEGVSVDERFDTVPEVKDAKTRPIPRISAWSGEGELAAENGWLVFKHKSGKVNGYELDLPMQNGVHPKHDQATDENKAGILGQGKNYLEFTFRAGAKATQTQFYVVDSDQTNLLKFQFFNSSITPSYLPAGGGSLTSISSISGINMQSGCTVKMLFDKQEGSLSLDQLWIDGGEKLTAPLALKGDADGLREVCFCPASGSQDVGEEALAIDSFRVYASALGILEQKAQEAGARLTFADIKGQNASAGAVEKDLDFSRTETANGLKIMGWKSSNTAVVTTAGKVTRPQSNDLRVTLTPVLGMEDAMNEADGDYITTDGAPITVTVKSIGGGEVKPENIFEYELNESFDAADYNAKEHPMGWANGWGDTNNTGKAEVKEGAMWIIHTKGVNESKYQVEIPFTYGYTASGGGSPICAVLPRDDLFVDFKWITDPKTREMTWYQCGKGSDAYTTSYVMRYNEETKKWDIQLRYRSGGEWKEMGVMKDLDLYSGENSVRIHLDASESGRTVLKGLWINGRPADVSQSEMADIGSGLHKLMVITKGSQGAGEVSLKITSMQVWHNFSAQLADMVQAKAEQVAFSAIAGTNKDQNAVTENLKLAAGQSSPSGQYTIGGWKTDRPEIIAADGTVTRPAYDQGDQQVTLTPVFTAWDPENVEGDQKVKADGLPLVVTVKALGAEEGIEYVKKTLSFEDIKGGNAGASAVEQDLVLISEKLGVTLDWELVSITPPGTTAGIDLKTGGIIRPEQNQSDVVVTLRARLSCEGEETVSNPISFTVKKLAVPTAEYLKTVSEALTFEVIAGENKKPQEIRGDLSLPAQFQGAKVIWTSSDKAVAADGTVTREPYPGNPVPVTLTARLAYGAAELTKTFSLTVEPEGSENLAKDGKVTASLEATAEQLAALFDEDEDTALPVKASVKRFNLVFDLGKVMPVSQAYFEEKELEPGKWAVREYTIDISEDNSTWSTVYTGTAAARVNECDFAPALARYVRINVTQKENGREAALAEAGVRFQPTAGQRVSADAESLTIDVPQRITGNSVSLPSTGAFGSAVSWSFTPSGLISDSFAVTHPAQDTNVTLVAEITSGSAAETKRFQRTVTGTGSGSGSGSRPAGGGSGGGGGTSPRLPESSDRPQPTAKPEDPNAPFADLGQAAWAGEYILGLYEQGVVSGKAEKAFMPLDNVTREEFVKMLALVFELETEKTGAFSDVEAGAWYAPYVGGAWRAGLVNGVADGVFGVGQNITRQDMAVMTWRAAEAAGLRLGEKAERKNFADQAEIADYALAAVSSLQKAGLFSGDENGAFRPEDNSTRAEAAKILYLLAAERNTGIGGY